MEKLEEHERHTFIETDDGQLLLYDRTGRYIRMLVIFVLLKWNKNLMTATHVTLSSITALT